MSVEKLSDCSKTVLQKNPFTQICNNVIIHIKDNDAFRVYAYLQSKSQEWKVIKENVKTLCKVGWRKLEYIFSYLCRSKLIRYAQIMDENGKFLRTDIQVLNGLDFDIDEPFEKEKSKSESKPDQETQLSTESHHAPALSAGARNRGRGNGRLLNKENTKERFNKNCGYEKPKKQEPKPSSYVERNTMTEEARTMERGDVKTAEHYLGKIKGLPRLKRYRNSDTSVQNECTQGKP